MSDLAIHEDEQLAPIAIQPLTLFGTTDPVEVLARATRTANALAEVIERQQLYTVIGNKKHVHVEGWTLLGSMLGVFPRVEWVRKLEDGFEARAVAIVGSSGMEIGAGEAQCTHKEKTWANRDDYTLRGMSQTRAISRALRGPLDFIICLAGFASLPAEELPGVGRKPRQRAADTPAVRPNVGADVTATADAKGDLASQDSGSVAQPSGEVGDMELLYHLGRTLPKKAATKEMVDLQVAEFGYGQVLRRLKAAHALQCRTAKCEHLP